MEPISYRVRLEIAVLHCTASDRRAILRRSAEWRARANELDQRLTYLALR